MSEIDYNRYVANEAWLLFQLNQTPVVTELDGDFNVVALMDIATGFMLAIEFIAIDQPFLSEFQFRKLLASAEGRTGERPQKLVLNEVYAASPIVKSAKAIKLAVVLISADTVKTLTQEVCADFATHRTEQIPQ